MAIFEEIFLTIIFGITTASAIVVFKELISELIDFVFDLIKRKNAKTTKRN